MNNDYYKDKYRVPSTRLKGYNYSQDGVYYVTICTKNRICFFGDVKNAKMRLSSLGKIADKCWRNIPQHFVFVELDEFVVMPNHVHGVIVINKKRKPVETQYIASLQNEIKIDPNYKNKFGPQSNNMASIIRGFKIGVKKWATINNKHFEWQSRYYDRIIRNDEELENIREYIRNNPAQWDANRNDLVRRDLSRL
jgi:putative transposase